MLQDDRVPHHGWPIALVIAESLEAARTGAGELHVEYERDAYDVTLTDDHPGLYTPEEANGGHPAVRVRGDVERALAGSPVQVDATYRTAALHNHPMEPHAATAVWADGHLTVHDSSQGSARVRESLARALGLDPDRITVVSEHVGGGFGSKGTTRPQAVLAAMAARHTGRPVKLVFPRPQLAEVVGHRAPTIQRVRLGADLDGVLTAVSHEIVTQTSTVKEFVEQAAVPARVMYASPHSRTAHRVTALDVPSPSWMRAPGRRRGCTPWSPPWTSWPPRSAWTPWSCGCATSRRPNPTATAPSAAAASPPVCATVRPGSAGTTATPGPPPARKAAGSWVRAWPRRRTPSSSPGPPRAPTPRGTAPCASPSTPPTSAPGPAPSWPRSPPTRSASPRRPYASTSAPPTCPSPRWPSGSSSTASWGWAVHKAATALAARLAEHRPLPADGITTTADTEEETGEESPYARHAFGAHFAETAVDAVTGEVRVRRLLGVYAAGRILNARTARSQFTGGMVMGIGMALTEDCGTDPDFGDFTAKDLASYHVPVCADTADIQAHWIEEDDRHLNPMGSKGIGEIGIVGTAAAIGNAVRHATGARLRELPLTPDTLLPYLL